MCVCVCVRANKARAQLQSEFLPILGKGKRHKVISVNSSSSQEGQGRGKQEEWCIHKTMKAKRTVLSTLAQLRSGTGAQRLPVPPLRSLEIRGIPSAHADRAHRAFVKTVIPRIKYWNDDLDIRFEIAEASKRPSPSAAKAAPSSSESSSESPAAAAASLSAAPTSLVRPSILLHYGEWTFFRLN